MVHCDYSVVSITHTISALEMKQFLKKFVFIKILKYALIKVYFYSY